MSKAFSFFLDGKALCAKIFKPIESLNNVRSTLKNKIDDSIIFLNGEVPIEISDEKDFTLEEIGSTGKIYLKHDDSNLKTFKIHLNGKYLFDYNANENEKLYDLRKKLGDKINVNYVFLMKNDNKVEKEDETGEGCFAILDIEEKGIIYLEEEEDKNIKEIILEKGEKNNKKDNDDKKSDKSNDNKCNYLFFL